MSEPKVQFNYDKKQLLKNIVAVAKEKKKKLGDVESQIGVAPGYFSRYAKDDNTANPGLEAVARAAEELNVTVDTLLYSSYDTLTTTDKYLMDKLNDLRIKTSNNSCLVTIEVAPKVAPNAKDPVSPMNTLAGCELK